MDKCPSMVGRISIHKQRVVTHVPSFRLLSHYFRLHLYYVSLDSNSSPIVIRVQF